MRFLTAVVVVAALAPAVSFAAPAPIAKPKSQSEAVSQPAQQLAGYKVCRKVGSAYVCN